MIVVTGSTGRIGRVVAEELAKLGAPMRLLVRDASRAPELPGAELAAGDYGDPDSLDRALEPGDRVFMVSMWEPPDVRLALHRSFVDAAARRRVARIVYLSFVAAGPEASFLHARSHGKTEAMLADSGLPFTAVRNAMYADEIAEWFDADGRITGPGGDGRISLSLRAELGAAIAVLLADPACDDRSLVTITTPGAVRLAELAAIASEATGDAYRYEPAGREEWIEYRRSLGREEWEIDAGISYYDGVRAGEADVVGHDYRALTGKEPQTIAEIVRARVGEMPLAVAR